MTQSGDPQSSSAGRSGDDLRKIDGVGRRFEQRLWDAGISTYEDLAQRTPEEIAAVLAPMAGISPERIASQARELAGSPPEAPVPRQHYAAFHVEFLLESDNSVRRTKVHQHQTDARDAWSGWDEERLLSFLRDRIPLPGAPTPARPQRRAAYATSRSFCASARLCSFFSDWFSIWRIRSRVTLNVRPTSSSVRGCSPPSP